MVLLVGGCCVLSECVKRVWTEMCVVCCIPGWGSECMWVGKGLSVCVALCVCVKAG